MEKIRKLNPKIQSDKESLSFIRDITAIKNSFIFPVIGDFIIDRYQYCKAERKNLEHHGIIYDLAESSSFYGGASNVASIMGCFSSSVENMNVVFISGCGSGDVDFIEFVGLNNQPDFTLLLSVDISYDKVIPLKTRYIELKRGEYLCRVDREPTRKEFPCFNDIIYEDIIENIKKTNSDSATLSDYNKGFISDSLVSEIIKNIKYLYCNIRPKKLYLYENKHIHFMSFNQSEFIESYNIILDDQLDVISVDDIHTLKESVGINNILITFGSQGFIFCSDNECIKVDALKSLGVSTKNIIGAGDFVMTAFAFFDFINRTFLNSNYSVDSLLELVNISAFLKVYTGNYTVPLEKIESYINGNLCLF